MGSKRSKYPHKEDRLGFGAFVVPHPWLIPNSEAFTLFLEASPVEAACFNFTHFVSIFQTEKQPLDIRRFSTERQFP